MIRSPGGILGGGAGPTISISQVVSDGSPHVTIFFSDSVSFNTSDLSDSQFVVSGSIIVSLSAPSSNSIDAEMDSPVNPGVPWSISSQPSWVITPLITPESGTTA